MNLRNHLFRLYAAIIDLSCIVIIYLLIFYLGTLFIPREFIYQMRNNHWLYAFTHPITLAFVALIIFYVLFFIIKKRSIGWQVMGVKNSNNKNSFPWNLLSGIVLLFWFGAKAFSAHINYITYQNVVHPLETVLDSILPIVFVLAVCLKLVNYCRTSVVLGPVLEPDSKKKIIRANFIDVGLHIALFVLGTVVGFIISPPESVPGPVDAGMTLYPLLNPLSLGLIVVLVFRLAIFLRFHRSLGMHMQKIHYNSSKLQDLWWIELGFLITLTLAILGFSWNTFFNFSWYPPPERLLDFMRKELVWFIDWKLARGVALGSQLFIYSVPFIIVHYLKHKKLKKVKD